MKKNKYLNNPLSWNGFLQKPTMFLKRVFLILLVENKKHASSKNMLLVLLLNIVVWLIHLVLGYYALFGNTYVIFLFYFLFALDTLIRLPFFYIKSKSIIYSLFLALPLLRWIIPCWNLYRNNIKP